MRTFLSIDLDFFSSSGICFDGYDVKDFFSKVKSTGITPKIFWEHDEMLPYINECKPNKIINVDFHSDVNNDAEEINEGTFFWFVENRKEISYLWRFPSECYLEEGYCQFNNNDNGFLPNIFKSTRKIEGIETIKWKEIDYIGICVSPNWITVEDVREVLLTYIYKWSDSEIKRKIKNHCRRNFWC